MKRRLLAALTALLLAVVGGVMLLAYVSAADQRAIAGLAPARVLVVTEAVPEGATAAQLAQADRARRGEGDVGQRLELGRRAEGPHPQQRPERVAGGVDVVEILDVHPDPAGLRLRGGGVLPACGPGRRADESDQREQAQEEATWPHR